MPNAIISVSDKTDLNVIVPFLFSRNYNIYSTGGTYTYIKNLDCYKSFENRLFSISSYTGFPEILNGRVKTLHPKIYGGILCDLYNKDHVEEIHEKNLHTFDLVIANLYPFKEISEKYPDDLEKCIENIDIGGVSLIRASSKNFKNVVLLSSPDQYNGYMGKFDTKISISDRKKYALQGFLITSYYDTLIYKYLLNNDCNTTETNSLSLKYGLNPHQTPSYIKYNKDTLAIGNAFTLMNGTLGYINVLDILHGWLTVKELEDELKYPAIISMKHTSPAGLGIGNTINKNTLDIFDVKDEYRQLLTPLAMAFIKSRNGDPLSSFGDFIVSSSPIDEITAKLIKREICDGIAAPGYSPEAMNILKKKKGGKFIIVEMNVEYYNHMKSSGWEEIKSLYGIELRQPSNNFLFNLEELKKSGKYDNELLERKKIDLTLAYTVLKYSQSNNISLVYNGQILGLGCGQQNRVGCVRLAGDKGMNWIMRQQDFVVEYYKGLPSTMKRQEKVNSTYEYIDNTMTLQGIRGINGWEKYDITMGSDGFFPFADNIDLANKYGVKYIVQPGGSIADTKVQEACDKYGIAMINIGYRMFYH